ncbi:MAG: hypothetical protein IJU73_05875 [Ruminococcus sp.]|nr:hypothetical protein [Ruminococcus sp.]
MKITDEAVIAMAVAVIAEEKGVSADKLRVVSFKKAQKSSLEEYIEKNNINYKKYRLGD